MNHMRWTEVSFPEAVRHCDGRTIADPEFSGYSIPDTKSPTGILFTDGTALVADSDYEGDWSEVTPGQGVMNPRFWIGKENV